MLLYYYFIIFSFHNKFWHYVILSKKEKGLPFGNPRWLIMEYRTLYSAINYIPISDKFQQLVYTFRSVSHYLCNFLNKRQLRICSCTPVSYTHLDVYKRQLLYCSNKIDKSTAFFYKWVVLYTHLLYLIQMFLSNHCLLYTSLFCI